MLRKRVCQRCYQFNEREWDVEIDTEWEHGGCIICPADHFNQIRYKGKLTDTGNLRGVMQFVFGWHNIEEGIPDCCRFKQDHENYKVEYK